MSAINLDLFPRHIASRNVDAEADGDYLQSVLRFQCGIGEIDAPRCGFKVQIGIFAGNVGE